MPRIPKHYCPTFVPKHDNIIVEIKKCACGKEAQIKADPDPIFGGGGYFCLNCLKEKRKGRASESF